MTKKTSIVIVGLFLFACGAPDALTEEQKPGALPTIEEYQCRSRAENMLHDLGDGFDSVELRFKSDAVSTGRYVQDNEEKTQHRYDLLVARDRDELRRALRIPARSPETCWDSLGTIDTFERLSQEMDPLSVVVLARVLVENPTVRSSSYALNEYSISLLDRDPSGVAFRRYAGDTFVSGYRPGAFWYQYILARAKNEQHKQQLLSSLAAAFAHDDVERQIEKIEWVGAFVSHGNLFAGPDECDECFSCFLGSFSCLRDNYAAFVKRASSVTLGAGSFETRPYISLENIPDRVRPALEAIERARIARKSGTERER
jgi:hypothetical protein